MSIKIYNGLRLTPCKDVFAAVQQVREVIEPAFYRRFLETMPEPTSRGRVVYDHWTEMDNLHRESVQSFSDNDFGYDVVFLPHRLILLYSEYHPYKEALLESGVVEEYSYWDNSDAPSELTEDEWAQRRRDWSSALDNFDKASGEVGLTMHHPSRFATTLHVAELLA